MSLESATFISQLVDTNPPGGDDRSTADDHLRVIKAVLKNQFINFNAVQVTATPAQLNGLANLSASLALVTNTLGVATTSTVTAAQLLQLAATLTASRAVSTGAGGVLQSSAASDAELDFLAGVTSAVQTQLDLKISSKYARVLQNKGHGGDGAVSIITNTNYGNIEYNATTFNINNAQTLTFKTPVAIIRATTSITISGNIALSYSDIDTAYNGLTSSSYGPHGSAGSGGGGGGASSTFYAGSSVNNGANAPVTAMKQLQLAGGAFSAAAGGTGDNGLDGDAADAVRKLWALGRLEAMLNSAPPGVAGGYGRGLSGEEGGAGGAGGLGAGLLILIAPVVTIDATSTITMLGGAGGVGLIGGDNGAGTVFGGGGGGSGGAGGVIIINTPSLTNSGTQTLTGGAGGAGGPGHGGAGPGGAGGAGADGYVLTVDTTA